MTSKIICGDCLDVLKSMPDDSVDLVFTSPPYPSQRSYGIGFNKTTDEWVDFAFSYYIQCLRVSRGLVGWVVEDKTANFRYAMAPFLLMANLHRAGVTLRKPPIYYRVGISGSGGPDWLRNDYELIICATGGGKLPWSDNTACGHPPKFPPGGNHSHHSKDGRVNRPRKQREGDTRRVRTYKPPEKANPGNVIKCHGGGGHQGHPLAHENEAPFPLGLAEFFVKSFCPPCGTVLDPFGGSGTVLHAAAINGRNGIAIDIRESQCDLMRRRMADVEQQLSKQTLKTE